MNCERVRELWDEYRDGHLPANCADARGLEQHLADCPGCEKLWRGESAWLAVLGDTTPISTEAEAKAFTASVLRRWEVSRRPSVVARIGPVARLTRLTAAAAVVAAMISLATLMVRNAGTASPTLADAESPGAVVLAEINAPIVAFREALDISKQLLGFDVDRAMDLMDTAVPSAEQDAATQ